MANEKTLNDLTPTELEEVINYIADAYNYGSRTRPEMIGELETIYGLSHSSASKIQEAVTQARIKPSYAYREPSTESHKRWDGSKYV